MRLPLWLHHLADFIYIYIYIYIYNLSRLMGVGTLEISSRLTNDHATLLQLEVMT